MPRKACIDASDALHHIIVRGIDRCLIFRDEHDRDRYLERLGDILADTDTPPLCMGFDAQPFPLVAQNGIDTGIAASSGKEIAGQEGYSLVEK